MGLDWSKLKTTLNPTFEWDSAVKEALGSSDSIEDVCTLYFTIELKGIHLLNLILFCLRIKSLDCNEMLLDIFRP